MPNENLPQTPRAPTSPAAPERSVVQAQEVVVGAVSELAASESREGAPSQARYDTEAHSASAQGGTQLRAQWEETAEPYRMPRFDGRRDDPVRTRVNADFSTMASYARRAGGSVLRFASANALPLALLGATLGWLAWSRRNTRARTRLAPYAGDERGSVRSSSSRASAGGQRPALSGRTTTGAKLMGVRVSDAGYEPSPRI